jgi:4-amino-4-deoxy-L-arabinose transferase-like glycosyltransferase
MDQLRAPFSLPRFLTCAVLCGLALRLIVVACVIHNVPADGINYNDFGWESWEMGWTARSIFLGHGFSSPFLPMTGPTALVPPLYPYFLAGIFHIFGLNTARAAFVVLGFNSLCSSLTCIPLYYLVRNTLNQRAARIAAFAWAIYPFAIYFSADRVWDYALTSLLFTCCLLLAQSLHRRGWLGWVGFGALYGLAVLSNPSVVSLLPFLLLIALYKAHLLGRRWFVHGLLASVAFIAVCTPWTIRNHRVMHADFFMRDGFWLEFYAGNNGDTHESNSAFAHPASNPAEMAKYEQLGEIRYMQQKHDLAVDFVQHHPGFFAVATLRRFVRFWTGYWSFAPSYLKYEPFDLPNVPFCLFLIFFMVKGLRRWWQEDRAAALPYLLALLVFPIPYYLTHSSMDYRQPLEPILVVLVTLGLFGTGTARTSTPTPQKAVKLQPEPETELSYAFTDLSPTT